MRAVFLMSGAVSLLLMGCVVHHHRRHDRPARVEQPPPPPPEAEPEPAPPPEREPPPRDPGAEGSTHRAPPAPDQPAEPEIKVEVNKTTARRGESIEVHVAPWHPEVMVFFNGRPLPKRTRGGHFEITIPANAQSGCVEIEWEGRRYRSPRVNVTP